MNLSMAPVPASPQAIRDVARLEALEIEMTSRLSKASKRFDKEQRTLNEAIAKPEVTKEQLMEASKTKQSNQ